MIFGQLGNDTSRATARSTCAGGRATLHERPSARQLAIRAARRRLPRRRRRRAQIPVDRRHAARDGNDYIEGGGGNDMIFGNQGQDDIIGGSSDLFTPDHAEQARPTAADMIFGGSGTQRHRAAATAARPARTAHAHDTDTIVGDNGDIFGSSAQRRHGRLPELRLRQLRRDAGTDRRPRAMHAARLHAGRPRLRRRRTPRRDIGAADVIHGEQRRRHHLRRSATTSLYGDGQNDTIVGGYGDDWISGGSGDDGILGDDGRIFLSRVGTARAARTASPVVRGPEHRARRSRAAAGRADRTRRTRSCYTADLTPDNLDHSTYNAGEPERRCSCRSTRTTSSTAASATTRSTAAPATTRSPAPRRSRSAYTNSYTDDTTRPATS